MPDANAGHATVAEALLAELARRGTKRIWGVPGGGSSLDVIAAAPRFGVDFVLARQEANAAMMALADAELTGAPGVVMTTKGPGVSNAANGLACATLERAPLLLLSDGFTEAQRGWLTHQYFDQQGATAAIAKGYARADGAAPAEEIAALLDLAQAAPRGAVHLDLTGQAARRAAPPAAATAPAGEAAAPFGDAAALLAAAHHPVILAGVEAAEPAAAAALRALAEALGCPVLVTYKAKGVMPDAHALYAGIFTGGTLEAACVGEADLILQVGLDPVELILQPWRYRAPILDLALRPHPVRYAEPQAALHGALADSIAALLPHARHSDWQAAAIARHRDAALAALRWQGEGGVSPPAIVTMAQAAAREAGRAPRVTVDAGAHMFSATALWQCEAPRDLLISNGLASMGFALPAGIAAALHDPARGAIAFTGDGGLMMCLGELATAAQTGARLVTIVFNDSALSLIDIKQQQRQLPPAGVHFSATDFARIAEGFGVRGFGAATPEAYRAALVEALALDGPSLIDVQVNPAGYPAQLQAMRG
ncbi:thiamine pyrophosphate-binding protein [Falsiroseomonas selenitidurans]|uniref:Thiamine pyrophosphate-binding protein n=1 Tax=Falsiroseomonas selenitidurans TaxID=2716335 RepID=A0ABX1DY39_9PROT|nr:thiamine pyrophosphate-binding protein [Falsiroseomonas selenitidurans]NKC29413.1 thiamine pyrophosphate-binding protein [Falsiroseomonas selenitidurans]